MLVSARAAGGQLVEFSQEALRPAGRNHQGEVAGPASVLPDVCRWLICLYRTLYC
jgi:hypothetical protein